MTTLRWTVRHYRGMWHPAIYLEARGWSMFGWEAARQTREEAETYARISAGDTTNDGSR